MKTRLTYICYKSVSFLEDLQEDSRDHSIRSIHRSLYLNSPVRGVHQHRINNPRLHIITLKILSNILFSTHARNFHGTNPTPTSYTPLAYNNASHRVSQTTATPTDHLVRLYRLFADTAYSVARIANVTRCNFSEWQEIGLKVNANNSICWKLCC
jgi:hypothetical protein